MRDLDFGEEFFDVFFSLVHFNGMAAGIVLPHSGLGLLLETWLFTLSHSIELPSS